MLSTPCESVQICTDPDRYSRIFRKLTSQKTVLKLKLVEQQLLESSSEMDKLPCKTYTKHSPDTKITLMGTSFPAQEFRVMEIFN